MNPPEKKFNKNPWERQDGETDKAFEAWVCYRDLPPDQRSYRNACNKLHKNLTTISQWAVKYHWQDRISAWQDFLDEKAVEARVDAIKKMHEEDRERERALGLNILGKVSERFLEKDTKGKPKLKVPDGQIPLWVKTGVELIRISDGLSTSKNDVVLTGQDGQPIVIEHKYTLVEGVKPPAKHLPDSLPDASTESP